MDEQKFQELVKSNDEGQIVVALKSAEDTAPIGLIKCMIPFLKHPNKNVARQAVVSFANLIKRQLVTVWSEMDKNVKDGLITLLKKLNPAIIDHIARDLYSEKEENRLRVLQVLGLLGQDDKIKQVVSEMLTDNDEKMRATAISILKDMIGTRDVSLIYRVLHDPDPRVRANGVEALEAVGNRSVVPTLTSMRKDPNNRVRGNVLKALYTLGFKKLDQDIKDMLESRNRLMRATAGWVIGELGVSKEEIFISLAGEYGLDRDPLVRSNMIKALIKIDTDFTKKLCKYMFDPDEVVKAVQDMERMKKFRGQK